MFADADFTLIFLLFAAAGVLICASGIAMTGLADRLADRTGMGEAIVGAVVLGAWDLTGLGVAVVLAQAAVVAGFAAMQLRAKPTA